MRYFLKELLEPISYLIYFIILSATYVAGKSVLYRSLAFYYAVAALLLFSANIENNLNLLSDWNYNLLFLVCACVFSYYYYTLCSARPQKLFIINCCMVNVLLFLYFDVFKGQFHHYNNVVYSFTFISIIVYSLFYYQHVLQHVDEESILHKFDFWLVSANLIYFLGAFIVVLLYDYTDLSIRGDLWGIQSVVLFFSALITGYGYLSIARRKR